MCIFVRQSAKRRKVPQILYVNETRNPSEPSQTPAFWGQTSAFSQQGSEKIDLCPVEAKVTQICYGKLPRLRRSAFAESWVYANSPYRVSTPNSDRNARWIWCQAECVSLLAVIIQHKNGAVQLVINPRLPRISRRSSSLSALLFLKCLKNSSRRLTTIAFTLTPSASAHSLSVSRACAPTWRS